MIHLTCGPMFAGKTSELLRIVNRFRLAKVPFVVVKPTVDTRTPEGAVYNHDGRSIESVTAPLSDFAEADVVLVDEVQFFDVDVVVDFLNRSPRGTRRYFFGLDLDARGKPWPTSAAVACMADAVVKITAVCDVCGSDATRTQRLTPWTTSTQVAVGAGADYSPRCLEHWRSV